MRTDSQLYSKGDKVRHDSRPEWGLGVVESAEKLEHEGRTVQRLVVTFEHRGRATVNTAYATLSPDTPEAPAPLVTQPSNNSDDSGGWLAELEEKTGKRNIFDLPDIVNDPFSTLGQKIYALLDYYRFANDARGLIDWAIAQTGLKDPLTEYSRHDLEISYDTFCRQRDMTLIELVKQAKKDNDQEALAQAGKHPNPRAQEVFTKALRKAAKAR